MTNKPLIYTACLKTIQEMRSSLYMSYTIRGLGRGDKDALVFKSHYLCELYMYGQHSHITMNTSTHTTDVGMLQVHNSAMDIRAVPQNHSRKMHSKKTFPTIFLNLYIAPKFPLTFPKIEKYTHENVLCSFSSFLQLTFEFLVQISM